MGSMPQPHRPRLITTLNRTNRAELYFPPPRGRWGSSYARHSTEPRGFHVEGADYPYSSCCLHRSGSVESKLLRISAGNDHEGGEASRINRAESAVQRFDKSLKYGVHGFVYPATRRKFGGIFWWPSNLSSGKERLF